MGLLNFEEQLVCYGQYHNNPWNRVVHIIFVPLLFWSFMVFVATLPVLMFLDQTPFNFSFAITFLYIFYYILLEPVAGAVYAPFLLTLTYSANVFAIKTSYDWKVPMAIQVLGWSCQILSHIFIERRSPAFIDNAFQALLLSPLFVFMELLFVLGYRPALQKRIHEKTKAAISTWKLRCERKLSAASPTERVKKED